MVSGAVVVAPGLSAALFPPDCRLCGAPLREISRLPVCPNCLLAMTPITGETCEICSDGVLGSTHNWGAATRRMECAACQKEKPSFTKATAYGAYDGGLRELIHLLKYERVEPAAGVLGTMLAEAIGKLQVSSKSLVVVPVPLYAGKRRERGFNQAELIARKALKELTFDNAQLMIDALERTRPTASQIGWTRPQPRENIRGAFRVAHPNKIDGRDVLLVDDVFTTGTTASECARILLKAGAQNVWVATVARTLKHQEALEIGPQFETAQAS